MRCSFCRGEAVYEARYSGARMCRYHFTESVERRVKREIRAQMDLKGNTKRIAVAVSGGERTAPPCSSCCTRSWATGRTLRYSRSP